MAQQIGGFVILKSSTAQHDEVCDRLLVHNLTDPHVTSVGLQCAIRVASNGRAPAQYDLSNCLEGDIADADSWPCSTELNAALAIRGGMVICIDGEANRTAIEGDLGGSDWP